MFEYFKTLLDLIVKKINRFVFFSVINEIFTNGKDTVLTDEERDILRDKFIAVMLVINRSVNPPQNELVKENKTVHITKDLFPKGLISVDDIQLGIAKDILNEKELKKKSVVAFKSYREGLRNTDSMSFPEPFYSILNVSSNLISVYEFIDNNHESIFGTSLDGKIGEKLRDAKVSINVFDRIMGKYLCKRLEVINFPFSLDDMASSLTASIKEAYGTETPDTELIEWFNDQTKRVKEMTDSLREYASFEEAYGKYIDFLIQMSFTVPKLVIEKKIRNSDEEENFE